MTRVSHLQVRKLLNEERGKKTDRRFFSSRILAAHFEDIAAAQSMRYGINRRISVHLSWEPKNPMVAATDYPRIFINSGCSLVTKKKSRQERYSIVCGIFAHEFGHNLFTDSLCKQSYLLQTANGNWYPTRPEVNTPIMASNERDIRKYIAESPEKQMTYLLTSKAMWNIFEDGFVDGSIIERFPGDLGGYLRFALDTMWEGTRTVTQLIDDETDERMIWATVMQLMIDYSRLGDIKYGETPVSDERIQLLFACINTIDAAIRSADPKDRWRAVNNIMVANWQYVKPYLEYCEEKQAEAAANGQGPDTAITTMFGGMAGATQAPSATTAPLQGGSSGINRIAQKRSKLAAQAADGNDPADGDAQMPGQAPDDEEPTGAEETGAPESMDEDDEKMAAMLHNKADEEATDGDDDGAAGQVNPVSAEEQGRIPFHETASVGEGVKGETVTDDEYAGSGYPDAGKDIEALLTRMAESSLEKKRTSDLNELAQVISYGDIHKDVKKTVHRIRDVEYDAMAEYESVAQPLIKISKKLQQNILRQINDRRRGGKETGLYMGRRIDAHALPRNDGRIFYKTSLPNETAELAVGLLIDESGSMSSCHRSTYARAAAIILYDFCQSLHIPVIIYGHSTDSGVDLYSYAEFDTIDKMDKYRLMDISARGCNRDGAALRYVAERLVRRPEDVKLLMLISDGQPNDGMYGGTAAEEDLRGIKQEYRRKGVNLIAAAIGDDRESIERIYGDSFLNISDLTKLPITLTQMVKRFIKA